MPKEVLFLSYQKFYSFPFAYLINFKFLSLILKAHHVLSNRIIEHYSTHTILCYDCSFKMKISLHTSHMQNATHILSSLRRALVMLFPPISTHKNEEK